MSANRRPGIYRSIFRSVLTGSLGGLAVRAINFLSIGLTVPWALQTLGSNGYGIYAVALSFASLAMIADLGLAMSLVNDVAKSTTAESDYILREKLSRIWWTVILAAAVITTLTLVCTFAAATWLQQDKSSSIGFSICAVLVGVPGAFYQRIAFARNLHASCTAVTIAGRLLALSGVYLCWRNQLTQNWFIASTLLLPAALNNFALLYLWKHPLRNLRPIRPGQSGLADRRDISVGISYLAVQILSFLETGVDALLIGAALGLSLIAEYDISVRSFVYVAVLVNLFALPLWPHIAKSIHDGHVESTMKIRKTTYIGTIVLSIAILGPAVMWRDQFFYWWTAHRPELSLSFYILLACYACMLSLSMFQSTFLQSLNLSKTQATAQLTLIVFSLTSKVLAVRIGSLELFIGALAISHPIKFLWLESKLASALRRN